MFPWTKKSRRQPHFAFWIRIVGFHHHIRIIQIENTCLPIGFCWNKVEKKMDMNTFRCCKVGDISVAYGRLLRLIMRRQDNQTSCISGLRNYCRDWLKCEKHWAPQAPFTRCPLLIYAPYNVFTLLFVKLSPFEVKFVRKVQRSKIWLAVFITEEQELTSTTFRRNLC